MDAAPCWFEGVSFPRGTRVLQDVKVDVAIVGAGITGLTAAYWLKRAGCTVAVVERGRLGGVDTASTTAHLTPVVDTRYFDLARKFGRDAARAVWDANGAAIDHIVSAVRQQDIACDFRWVPGYLHAPPGGDRKRWVRALKKEAAATRALGIRSQYLESVPLVDEPGLLFPHQALFHPRKYLAALARAIPGRGSHLFEHSAVEEVQDRPLAVKIGRHRVQCGRLFLATHTPLMGRTGMLPALLFQTKLYLYTSYALGARLPAGLLPEASWWDTGDPYSYLRVERKRGFAYAIYGGEDHKTGQARDTAQPFARLERRFHALIPEARVDHRWSGQVVQTNDGLPFIGETAERQFVATGFAGNGMTWGTLGGLMAADWVLKRKNPWGDLFDPQRKKIRGGTWVYLKENADYPYYLVRDWIGGAEGGSLRALRRGAGKILHLRGRKVAAYRSEDGKLTLRSPVCTHLQCIVHWNQAESTWDCPCHGSRFTPAGAVIAGPAEEPLAEVKGD